MADFSTKQFKWCDVTVVYGGKVIQAVSLEYASKQEKEYLYGRGCKAHAIQSGNIENEGKIGVWQSELESLIRDQKLKGKSLLDLSFDVTIAFTSTEGVNVIDTLKGVQFTEIPKSISQGDKRMAVELPIMFLDIEYQV